MKTCWTSAVVCIATLTACAPQPARTASDPACTVAPTPTAQAGANAPKPEPPSPARPIRVAITVDDLPAHGPLPSGVTRLAIHKELLAAFRAHHIPPVTGFINAKAVADEPETKAALDAWLGAGNPLGNHTYSHPNLKEMPVSEYIADIDQNEPLLVELTAAHGRPPGEYKTFRYPYLEQGSDEAGRNEIRTHLFKRGYRVAEVTIDFGDWAWNGPYARCLEKNDEKAIAALERSFILNAVYFLRWAEAAALELYGRPIPHILLLHAGAFDAKMIDRLLTAYEKAGVEFVSLETAMKDAAYAVDVPVAPSWGHSLLEKKITAEDAPHPPYLLQPLRLLDSMCR